MVIQAKTDKDLVDLLEENLCEHFEILVQYYQKRLYIFVLSIIHDSYEAEDIVQETFINIYKYLRLVIESENSGKLQKLNLRPWIFTIAHNITLNHINRKENHFSLDNSLLSVDRPDGREVVEEMKQGKIASAEELVENKEQRRILHEKIACLPYQQRQAVFLHYLVGLEYQDIGTLLNRPVNTVKCSGRMVLAKLRIMLLQTVNLDESALFI